MKTARKFHSDFFNCDCLESDGEIYFSITGASKVINGNTAGPNIKGINSALAKIFGPNSPVAASDSGELGEKLTVQTTSGKGRIQDAEAITQDTFIEVLKQYKGRKSIGGKNAEAMLDRLLGVSIDLILRKEAGLLHVEAAKEIDASILRTDPDKTLAYKNSPLGVLVQTMWEDFSQTDTKAPFPHPTGFGREMAFLLRHGIYSRITGGLLAAVNDRKPSSTIWQNLSDEVRAALTPVILFYAARVRTDGWHNVSNFIKEADAIWPRFNQGTQETKRSLKLSAA
jgi:hypothetical protein